MPASAKVNINKIGQFRWHSLKSYCIFHLRTFAVGCIHYSQHDISVSSSFYLLYHFPSFMMDRISFKSRPSLWKILLLFSASVKSSSPAWLLLPCLHFQRLLLKALKGNDFADNSRSAINQSRIMEEHLKVAKILLSFFMHAVWV